MIHDSLGMLHLVAALASVVLGAVVLMRRKGTRWHRRLGHAYATLMLSTNLSALFITRLTGEFNLLHAFAVLSLTTVTIGVFAAWKRWPGEGWFEMHYRAMAWSYIGLWAALVSESATRILLPWMRDAGISPKGWFWPLVGIATFVVVLIGALWLERRRGAWRAPPMRAVAPREKLPRT